jgi:hypothetical protein
MTEQPAQNLAVDEPSSQIASGIFTLRKIINRKTCLLGGEGSTPVFRVFGMRITAVSPEKRP